MLSCLSIGNDRLETYQLRHFVTGETTYNEEKTLLCNGNNQYVDQEDENQIITIIECLKQGDCAFVRLSSFYVSTVKNWPSIPIHRLIKDMMESY